MELPQTVENNSNGGNEIKSIYHRVFSALEEASCLSRTPHCLTKYMVTEKPMLPHVLAMVEPLNVSSDSFQLNAVNDSFLFSFFFYLSGLHL